MRAFIGYTLALAMAVMALATGYVAKGIPVGAILVILPAAGFWVAVRTRAHLLQRAPWLNSWLLVWMVGICVIGAWLDVAPVVVVVGMTAALCAWDISAFMLRMSTTGSVETAGERERRHLARLAPVVVSGLVLGGLTVVARLNLSFGVLTLLGILAIAALYAVSSRLKGAEK